jgi:plasmid stability protein
MRTTLTLDDDIGRALKDLARHAGKSFKTVVNEVLRQGLTSGAKPERRRARFTVASARRGFVPGIDPFKLNQLVDDLEVERFLAGSVSEPRRT